jgi:hypothetical protein
VAVARAALVTARLEFAPALGGGVGTRAGHQDLQARRDATGDTARAAGDRSDDHTRGQLVAATLGHASLAITEAAYIESCARLRATA